MFSVPSGFLRFKFLCSCNTRVFSTIYSPLFAGHSKWANIKHIKAAKDGEKSVLFSKLSRQIRLALQEGGSPDPALNIHLKSAIEEALRKNMPIASINNNIQKFKDNKKELKRYQINLRYKQKVFLVCVIYTDNFPNLKTEIAPILRKSGVTIIDTNIFEENGLIEAYIKEKKEIQNFANKVVEDAIAFGAEDVEIVNRDQGLVQFICKPSQITSLRNIIETNGYTVENAEHIYTPTVNAELSHAELREFKTFIDKMNNLPGVEEIYDNIRQHC